MNKDTILAERLEINNSHYQFLIRNYNYELEDSRTENQGTRQ